MQMIKDLKESILSSRLPRQFMDVINQEHVYKLVEMRKIIGGLVPASIHELLGKQFSRYIQNGQIRIVQLGLQANGVQQMRFAKPGSAVHEQGVETGLARLLSYGITRCPSQTVAIPFHKIIKRIVLIQLRIDLDLLQARNHKRIGQMIFRRHWHSGRLISGFPFITAFGRNSVRIGIIHYQRILQTTFWPQYPMYRGSQQIYIVLFQPLEEKRTRNLYGQGLILKSNRFNRLEPSTVISRFPQIVPNNLQALFPYSNISLFHLA